PGSAGLGCKRDRRPRWTHERDDPDRLWPYHAHHANEEWVIVLRGEPTLRTPDGQRSLREGDVVCFPRIRSSTEPHRGSVLSTAIQPESSNTSTPEGSSRTMPRANTSCSPSPTQRPTTGKGRG